MSTRSYWWYIKRSNKGCIVPCNNRAVTKFLSCRVYAASRWETEQPKSSLCFILLMFHLKVARGHANQLGEIARPWPVVTVLNKITRQIGTSPVILLTLCSISNRNMT